jgi:hypothetical protein
MGDMFDVVIAASTCNAGSWSCRSPTPRGGPRARSRARRASSSRWATTRAGWAHTEGAGFKMPGGKRRSMKSKRRDKGKKDHRADRKNKGKRQ